MARRDDPTRSSAGARDRTAPPTASSPTLTFAGITGALAFVQAAEVADALTHLIESWPCENHLAPGEEGSVLSRVEPDNDGYRLTSEFLDEPLVGLPIASAACGVIADLAQAYFEQRPGTVSLHGGAFATNGHAVALMGAARAGKSTLMARLTAESDLAVLCDDVLPVDQEGQAVGLGVPPRIRLPLPAAASPGFRSHVARNTTLADDKYAYVGSGTIAPHGTRLPLRGFVLLDRQQDGPARLHRLEPTEAILAMATHNMADTGPIDAYYERLNQLADTLTGYTLVYSDLEDAVSLLRAAFVEADGRATITIHPPRRHPATASAEPDSSRPPIGMEATLHRAATVSTRRIGQDLVLWHPDTGGVFRMNAIAAAIWTLLADPMSGEAIVSVLTDLFPDQDARIIADDVASLLQSLADEALIRAEA